MTARIAYLSALTQRSSTQPVPSAQPVLRPARRPFAEQALPVQTDWTSPLLGAEQPGGASHHGVSHHGASHHGASHHGAGADPTPAASQPKPDGTNHHGASHHGASHHAASAQNPQEPAVAQDPRPAITSQPTGRLRREHEPAERDKPAAALAASRPDPAPPLAPTTGDSRLPPRQPEILSFPVLGETPDSWTDPRWGQPVELPQPLQQKEFTGPVPPPRVSPAERQAPRAQPRPLPDRRPLPSAADFKVEVPGLDTGPGRRRPPSGQRAQVSIGSIEVTVVPPAPPAAPQSPPPERRDRPRPVAPPPAFSGADRLRDGLRRWHGIAQG